MKKLFLISAVSLLLSQAAIAQTSGWPSGSLSAPGGRYVFGQINQMARDQYLLDTQTGRLWQVVCRRWDTKDPEKCAGTTLQPMEFMGPGGSAGYAPADGGNIRK